MKKLALFLATCIVSGAFVVIPASAANACEGPDGMPCPGERECHAINDAARKIYKDDLLACPT